MNLLFPISLALLTNIAAAQTQRTYSRQDSMNAHAYYDSSWHYGMSSIKHQRYLDSALQVIPSYAPFWQQKAMPLYKAGKYQLARPFIDSAVKYAPLRYLDYRAFMECIFEKNYRDAMADFYTIRSMPGNSAVVMDHPYNFYIGLCHLQLNNYDSSLYYFKNLVDEERKTQGDKWIHYNHLFYLGIAYYVTEDYVKANDCFTEALAHYDKFCDAQYYKAMCLFKLNKKKEAADLMETALANNTAGYSINEDNAIYEYYPYQPRKAAYKDSAEWLRKEADKNN